MALRPVMACLVSLALTACTPGSDGGAAAAACRLLGEATQKTTQEDMMFGLAEAQRTARNNGEPDLARQLEALAEALRSGDSYAMGTAAIDVNQTCMKAGVNIDEEF